MKSSSLKARSRMRRDRKGVAMVLALVLIVILSATAAAALGMVGSERRVVEDQEAAAEAHALARSAYDQFVADPTSFIASFNPATFVGPDSGHKVFSDGYAWVSIQRVRPSVSGSPTLFLIRSRAVRTVNRPYQRTPVAQRVFSQYAQWQDYDMPALAAWTSLSGLLKNGAMGTISGTDACGAGTPVAGVAVPNNPGYVQTGGTSVPTGSPPVLNMGSQPNANGMVSVDWTTILTTMAFSADVVMPGTWPSFSNTNYWPVIYVDQTASFSLPTSGRGMLIVKNDAVINGGQSWDGIILVGGTFTSNGTNTVSGALVTGLNVLLGQNVPPSNIGNGTKTYRYDSCNVEKAMGKFNGLAPLRNSSADNWASY